MSLSTLDQLLAGMLPPEVLLKANFTAEAAGELHSAWYLAGRPGAATAPTGLNGSQLSSVSAAVAGQIPFPAAVAGKDVYLAGLSGAQGSASSGVWVCDRLWHNGSIDVTNTGAQAITHPGIAARDLNGTVNGEGVLLGLEVSTATTQAGAVTTITASYTNQSGTSGKTASIPSFPATAVAGEFVPFTLAAGDTGVRSVQSLTLGTTLSAGTVHLVQYRPIAFLPLPTAGVGWSVGPFDIGRPVMYAGSVPFLLYAVASTTGGRFTGQLQYSQA